MTILGSTILQTINFVEINGIRLDIFRKESMGSDSIENKVNGVRHELIEVAG